MAPESTGVIPVVEADGAIVGIVEPHDLLRASPGHLKLREIARHDYVLARPDETVDLVTRMMITQNAENVVIVQNGIPSKPIGVARAADILRLRRRALEEESSESSTTSPT